MFAVVKFKGDFVEAVPLRWLRENEMVCGRLTDSPAGPSGAKIRRTFRIEDWYFTSSDRATSFETDLRT